MDFAAPPRLLALCDEASYRNILKNIFISTGEPLNKDS